MPLTDNGVTPRSPVGEEDRMRRFEQVESWEIYHPVNKGLASGPHAVCEQDEWALMERDRPGSQTLVQCGDLG